MIPTLKQVAEAISLICKNGDAFTPSMVRQLLGRNFTTTEAATLSAQIQPHLRTLREAGIIIIKQTNQRRNRPHQLINRELLKEISLKDEYFVPQKIDDMTLSDEELEESEDPITLLQDETTNAMINMERRLMEIEEIVDSLVAKLNAISSILRP